MCESIVFLADSGKKAWVRDFDQYVRQRCIPNRLWWSNMRVFVCICIFAGTLLAVNPQGLLQNKFGIRPLHSTRADVERVYGPCDDPWSCMFRTTTEAITVAYAKSPCVGLTDGWDVFKDTVLSVTVRPFVYPRLSDTGIDLDGFVKRYSNEATVYYTNVEKGIVFSVQDGHVTDVTHFPPSNENGKRCKGFPPYDGVHPPRPFQKIFTRNKEAVNAHLDNFSFELANNTQVRGYVVTYAGKNSYPGEGKRMANEARRYLIKQRRISPKRVIAIDGGFRENAEYDLFLLPPSIESPRPTPTVPSNEVQIIGTRRRN
ncbi:MAG TPA: hypothetical protein VFD62_06110 [Pyrinomonadaceae bacterium]|nr:hypothetical protein [Pyrinomonadaceae bacterium]